MNLFEINDPKVIVEQSISNQEKIRLLFRLGLTRSQISKLTGFKYQIVFKAVNPKYAPKRWVKVLTVLLERERSNNKVEIEEVKLFTK